MGNGARGSGRAGRRVRLIERDAELAAIDAGLAASIKREGRLLLVEGQPGIGKSELVAASVELAEDAGLRVLYGQGTELERGHSFGVVMQLFESTIAALGPQEREETFAGAAALSLSLFAEHATPASSPDEQAFTLLHGLHWLTANLAERRPLLIAADDLHWTDRPSLRFFLYLAQRLPDLPVVVVASARPAEPSAPKDLLRQLRRHSVTELLEPAPLSPAGVKSLVGDRMPGADAEFVDACRAVTEGNPYLLCELLADLGDRGVEPTRENAERVGVLAPDTVLDAALVRLARLPTGASALARATAVLVDDASFGLVAALANLDASIAAPIVDALAAAEILSPGERLSFVHPLLHSAIYHDLPAAERAETHRRAARLLDDAGAPVETVAAHLLASTATGDEWVVERLKDAAARSLARGAPESAARYLARALEEGTSPAGRVDLLVRLGEAEALAGYTGGIERLEQALALVDDPRRRAEVFQRLGWMLQQTGDLSLAVKTFERGLAEIEHLPATDLSERMQLHNLQVAHLGAAMLEPEHAAAAHARVRAIVDSSDVALSPAQRGLLSIPAMHLLFKAEQHETVIELSRRVWAGGRILEDHGTNSPTVWHVVGCLSWADALDDAEAAIEATLDAARREGSIVTQALALYSRSWPRFWRGDLAGAAADAEAAVNAWSGEFTMYLPVAAYWLAMANLELGQTEAAAAAVDYPGAFERWGQSNMYGPLLAGQGLVAMANGDPAAAVRKFEAAGGAVLGAVVANPALLPWRSFLAQARLATGDADGAREAARDELELARRFGAPRPIGISLRAAGLVEGGARGLELLEESVATLRRSPSRIELTRSLVDLGAMLRRQGQRAAARVALDEAHSIARASGAVELARRAHDELLAAGARPRRAEAAGVDALTPSERRVAELVAAGMTNREIAQSLFVTVKTVQFHLTSVYRKLELTSRDELCGALGEQPPNA